MAEKCILTSLLVPVTTNGPSQSALQWSEDGQAFIVTRGAVYILTPNTGINFDPSSVIIASSVPTTSKDMTQCEALSWYRNMIELDKTPIHYWPFECQEWGTLSLGSLDMSWVAIALSPTNLSKGSCCLMAALNTNLEVSLWAPSKNYLTGEWSKVQDVTQAIKDSGGTFSTAVQETLNAQVHSISWSGQAETGERKPCIDGSLLALGNRAGRIILMRLTQGDNEKVLQSVASLDVADDWITQLAWSPWAETKPGCFRSSLACGTPDGGLIVVSVLMLQESEVPKTRIQPRLELSIIEGSRPLCPCDGSAVTALMWIDSNAHAPILAYAKPGVIYLQKMPSDLPLGWDGTRTLILRLQPTSSSSSSYTAVSGFLYYAQHDALLVILFDGSAHMIHSISTSPSLDTPHQALRSEDLTSTMRMVFGIAEGKVSFADANRISGVFDYDGAGSIGWLHENSRPDDMSYIHDAKHASMFIVTRLWKDEDFILESLASLLRGGKHLNAPPPHLLRGVFLHLREKSFLDTHHSRVLKLLAQPEEHDDLASWAQHTNKTGIPSSRLDFRQSVADALYRERDVRSCQLKLVVAMFCSQVRGIDPVPFEDLVTRWTTVLSCLQLRAVLRQFEGFVDQLEECDRVFVHYWIMLCRLQKSYLLQEEVESLAARAGVSALENLNVQEHCPACHTVIPLGIVSSAVCLNGHSWTRCSITSFILATPSVRTCVGCCRKTFLPLSQRSSESDFGWLPPAANCWLVEELLEAASWCTFCGNRFVRAL